MRRRLQTSDLVLLGTMLFERHSTIIDNIKHAELLAPEGVAHS